MDIITRHQNLVVWQKAVALASKVYAATQALPSDELHRRLRRATISIASRIAEGSACGNRTEFVRLLHRARGALSEAETQIMIAANLGMILQRDSLLHDIEEVGRLLNGLSRNVASASRTAHAKACASHAAFSPATASHPLRPPRTHT